MPMNRINLPHGGFKDGRDGVKITALEAATGQEGDGYTEIFVRGKAIIAGAETRFAGTTILREGRDTPDADLDFGEGGYESLNRWDRETHEALTLAIHLCLDHCDEGAGPDRFSVGAEMARICGDE